MNIRIACLSRLTSSKEVKNILAGLESGEISIVIATHRILGDDVRIRRL
jgi:transcription-repair coupling factor (superfamily II helicase)